MLKLLSKLFKRDLTSPSEPIDTDVSQEEIWAALHPNFEADLAKRKKNLPLFVQFITAHLGKTESLRLSLAVECALDEDNEDSFQALSDVMGGEEGQQRGKWFLIDLDWNATEEINWQVNECLGAWGVPDRWETICEDEFATVPEALRALSEWLTERDFSLLHLETGGDCYASLIVKTSDLTAIRELATAADLILYDEDEFLSKNS